MEERLFILIRLGLKLSNVEDEDFTQFLQMSSDDWSELTNIAEEHGVSAIVFDGYQELHKHFDGSCGLPMDSLMDWLGQVFYLEERNKVQIEVLNDFCSKLVHDCCTVMLMKGQANGLLYPNPLHRSTGDVDIYTFDTYGLTNQKSFEYGAKVDDSWYKHSQIFFNGEMFENHQYFVHTRDGKRGKQLNETLCVLLRFTERRGFHNTDIMLPPIMFNALFLTYHAFAHFISEGLHLKQVCDWALFLNQNAFKIDWTILYSYCEQFHLKRFLDVMNDIAVHKLGVVLNNPVIITESPYSKRVLQSILFDEDFVFGSGEGSWNNRFHLIRNMWKYRWKYNEIYETSILKQFYYYASGYIFHTE